MKNSNILIIVSAIIFIVMIIYLIQLDQANRDLAKELNELNQDNLDLKAQLVSANGTIQTQEQKIGDLGNEVGELNQKLVTINNQIKETENLLTVFNSKVEESSSWFKTNSNIDNFNNYDKIKNQIKYRCVEISNGICNIKLSCFPLVHDELQDFSYKDDSSTTGSEDKLQSLTDFYQNNGGDCEDYSLVVKAELNSLNNYCENQGANQFNYEAVIEGNMNYDIDFTKQWYYQNADKFEIPSDYTYYYIVCGNFRSESDPNSKNGGALVGHCAIAFTNSEIKSSSDIYGSLVNSIIIEPQTGLLSYDLRSDKSMSIPYSSTNIKNSNYNEWGALIFAVITDDNYYLFDEGNLSWSGYKDFFSIIDKLKTELETVK